MKQTQQEPSEVRRAPRRKETDIEVRLRGAWVMSKETGKREPSPALVAFAEALGEFCANLYLEGKLPRESQQVPLKPDPKPATIDLDAQLVTANKAQQAEMQSPSSDGIATVDVLTPAQVGRILQIATKTIVALCARGDVPGARKVGRQWRIPRWGLEAMFAEPGLTEVGSPQAGTPVSPRSLAGPRRPSEAESKMDRREILALLRAPMGEKPSRK
jgi:hypothetical protein